MGAGKSSVGRMLGKDLGWAFEDLDDRIERRELRTIAEIFRVSGEPGFRRAEHQALVELLGELQKGAERIVALGGGAFSQRQSARLIKSAQIPTIFLDAGVMELWRRCRQQAEVQGTERPLLRSFASFRDLYRVRRPHYMKASLRHRTGGKTVEKIAADLVEALGLNRSSGRRGEK
jgi:shikimate kinase